MKIISRGTFQCFFFPFSDIDMQAQFNMNQSRAEEITIREEFESNTNALLGDDGFGDIG